MASKVTFTTTAMTRVQVSAGDTASWYYLLDVPAATVDAKTVEIGGKATDLANAYWVLAGVPATIVGGYLPSGIDQYVGQPFIYHVQAYGFQVRNAIDAGSATWSLVDDTDAGEQVLS